MSTTVRYLESGCGRNFGGSNCSTEQYASLAGLRSRTPYYFRNFTFGILVLPCVVQGSLIGSSMAVGIGNVATYMCPAERAGLGYYSAYATTFVKGLVWKMPSG